MQSSEFIEKLKDNFDEMVLFKDLQNNNFTASFKLPSFMRDWVVKRFQDENGLIEVDKAIDFVKSFIPKKEDWKAITNRIVHYQEKVKFLAKISVNIDIRTQAISFSLPDFGLSFRDTVIPEDVWERCNVALLKSEENWGLLELGYQYPDDDKTPGKIKLLDFKDFCPYIVDLDEFKSAREAFSLDEWLDIILGAIDYNPEGYESQHQKLAMITRLLPFVEKRLNLIELAPKGTGKSYLFGSVSRYSWLSSGGTMSRARMFYDMSRRTEGLVFGHDYVALDEVQTVNFTDVDEMRGALKGYMENNGKYTVGNHEGSADAGIILLGNIPADYMNEYKSMFTQLPAIFHESALIDRFHGFLKGWELPRMRNDMKVSGWSLNSEYYSTIMHTLRDDASYRRIVEELVEGANVGETRDTEAILRICTAYMKLLFPHVRSADEMDKRDFLNYCLRPATEMRAIIKIQLGILDPGEFGGVKSTVPELTVRDL